MGTDYEDFLLFGRLLQVLFLAQVQNEQVSISQKAFCYLMLTEQWPIFDTGSKRI